MRERMPVFSSHTLFLSIKMVYNDIKHSDEKVDFREYILLTKGFPFIRFTIMKKKNNKIIQDQSIMYFRYAANSHISFYALHNN